MKKSKFLLATLLVLPLLVACNETVYHPKHSFPEVDPLNPDAGGAGEGEGQGEGEEELGEKNMTINFYLDYSHTDQPKEVKTDDEYVRHNAYEPVYVMRWYMLKPLGSCPAKAVLTDADAPDPTLYGKFLGYSEYPSAMDESLLWNFETDYKQSNVLNLYGIWVNK